MSTIPLNKILTGDCIEIMNGLPENSFDLIFADPPYNLQLENGLLRPNQTVVDAVDDHWDQFASFEEYDRFTLEWLTAARRVLKKTGTLWVIGSYHNIYRVGAILMNIGYWILNDVVWVKSNPMPQMKGVRLCNAHETLLWAKKSKEATGYTFNYRDMKAGNEDKQLRSDWYFPICLGGERETNDDGSKAHATQKPEALLYRIIAACSRRGDLVMDPFCGSGTTAAVAKALGRNFVTIDREPDYVEVARSRVDRVIPFEAGGGLGLIDQPKPKVPFLSFVESGALPPGTRLFSKPRRIEAIVQEDGTIAANGHRGSIHKVGKLVLGLPACNGWDHWTYRDPKTGQEHLIDNLRPTGSRAEEAFPEETVEFPSALPGAADRSAYTVISSPESPLAPARTVATAAPVLGGELYRPRRGPGRPPKSERMPAPDQPKLEM
ncbi:MAG: site-specific DNA-methyltransferase [Capsulimonadaceae bacterium]